jgi:protein SCO1/2
MRRFLAALCALVALAPQALLAARPASLPESAIDPAVLQIDELKHLGTPLDAGLPLVDQDGRPLVLGELRGRPAILLLSYYGCDGTCSTFNRSLAHALEGVGRFRIGTDYQVLTVSFDKTDTVESTRAFVDKAGLPDTLRIGWRHAVLRNAETDIARLTGSLGFNFFWSRADQTFLHPNVMVFLTPDGRVARYLYGNRLDPGDIEKALIEADWNRIANSANVIDILTGVCFSYSYAEGRYHFNYSLFAGLGSMLLGLSIIGLGAFVYKKRMGRLSHAQ